MSLHTTASVPVLIKEQELALFAGYCIVATTSAYVWHYFVTFDWEIKYFWKRKLAGANVIFLANRYLSPLLVMMEYLAWTGPTTLSGEPSSVNFDITPGLLAGQRCTVTMCLYTITALAQHSVWTVLVASAPERRLFAGALHTKTASAVGDAQLERHARDLASIQLGIGDRAQNCPTGGQAYVHRAFPRCKLEEPNHRRECAPPRTRRRHPFSMRFDARCASRSVYNTRASTLMSLAS